MCISLLISKPVPLIQMGERKESIYVIGSPEVDVMLSGDLPTIEEVKLKYGISFNEYLIFIYHPVVTELDKIERNMRYAIKALKNSVKNYVVIIRIMIPVVR